jgi:hypothetical protein
MMFMESGGGLFLTFEEAGEGSVVMFPYAQVPMIEMPMHQLENGSAALEQELAEGFPGVFPSDEPKTRQ